MIRYQVGTGGDQWTAPKKRFAARLDLFDALRKERPSRYKKVGDNPWNPTSGPFWCAIRMMKLCVKSKATIRTDSKVFLRRLQAEVAAPSVPAAAARTPATKATVAFYTEIALVFPEAKSLGLYVPKKVAGTSAYYSEHAWAAAQDWGKRARNGQGYDISDKLYPYLKKIHSYILANWYRLKPYQHIFDGKQWLGPNSMHVSVYSGSDAHRGHTHTGFADHDGRKPPWL